MINNLGEVIPEFTPAEIQMVDEPGNCVCNITLPDLLNNSRIFFYI